MTVPTTFAQFSIGTANGCPSSHVGYDSDTNTFTPNCGGNEQTTIKFSDWDLEGCVLEHLDLSQCTGVTSIEMDTYTNQFGDVYDKDFCGTTDDQDAKYNDVQSIIFPPNLVEIPESFFYGCGPDGSLTSIDFGDNSQLQTIERSAFKAGGVTSVNFGANSQLKTIGTSAFNGARLSSIVIPSSVETIEGYAFAYQHDGQTYSLQSVTFENDQTSAKSFVSQAFHHNENLETFRVPDGIESIDLKYSLPLYYIKHLIIPTSVTELTETAGSYCTLETLVFLGGSQLQTIPNRAFKSCPLTSVNFGANSQLKTIRNSAFYGARLSSIVIPSSVETIEDYAFAYQYDGQTTYTLQSVTFECGGENIASIGNNAFQFFTGTVFHLPRQCYHVLYPLSAVYDGQCTIYTYEDYSFSQLVLGDWDGLVTVMPLPITAYCARCPMDGDNEATEWTGDTFEKGTYEDCKLLVTVTFTGTVLPENAFKGATSLATINMPSIETIGANAFENTAISNLDIPETVTLADDIGVSYTIVCGNDGVFIEWSSGGSHGLTNACLDLVELHDVQNAVQSNFADTGKCLNPFEN